MVDKDMLDEIRAEAEDYGEEWVFENIITNPHDEVDVKDWDVPTLEEFENMIENSPFNFLTMIDLDVIMENCGANNSDVEDYNFSGLIYDKAVKAAFKYVKDYIAEKK